MPYPSGVVPGYGRKQPCHPQTWEESEYALGLADVAVISVEDVQYDEEVISKMASEIPIFVVTENFRGARVYWHNDARFIKAPKVKLSR